MRTDNEILKEILEDLKDHNKQIKNQEFDYTQKELIKLGVDWEY
jgi:hypothetical protein